ncbi:hypothetical protein CC78DRAFT_281919 [Lojkania enalia]|uniref:Uncharacterized protein n=1 Tax=Lojkania enalia TaxID=147567 RepID=A0A9P4NAH7_9PLEO|nr:hypothetical protein CC78DRAFT_281919 [Didymosphaeria enalia]
MSSLMTLPRELRDTICAYVILDKKNDPPPLDRTFEQMLEGRESFEAPKLRAWSSPTLIKYRPDNFVATSTPLMLVNKQLHAETKSNLGIMRDAYSYEVDIVVLDEIILIPTWLRVPVLTPHVETVKATFRISGSYMPGKQAYQGYPSYKGFQSSNGAGAAMAWEVYSVLERFFRVGPLGSVRNSYGRRNIGIKTLDINFETPPGIEPWRFVRPRSQRSYFHLDVEGSTLSPDELRYFVDTNIMSMLSLGHRSDGYGNMFYEHLDEIVIRKDGEECTRYDIARMFNELEFTNNCWTRSETIFNNWKRRAVSRRMELGLKVAPREILNDEGPV